MRAPVAITVAICSLALASCSRLPWCSCPEPPALAPRQYGGTYPNSYDPLSRPNSYEGRYGNSYDPQAPSNAYAQDPRVRPSDPYGGSPNSYR
jgi:hypothetical protein